MKEGATGLREQRRRESAERVIELAREWTARDGFTGYTVDELCDAARVSRRTFFNYFASKEDAVLGVLAPHGFDELAQDFLDGGPDAAGGGSAAASSGLSATLVDDFVTLHLARWELIAPSRSQSRALKAALDREPRLHTRIFEQLRAHERRDVALIEKRENLRPGDVRASTLVHVVGAFSRAAAEEYFGGDDVSPPSIERFARLFTERLTAARVLLG